MERKRNPFPLLAGILFALMALLQLFTLVGYFHLWGLLYLVAYGLMAAAMFLERRDLLTGVGFALAGLLSLIFLFTPYSMKLILLLEFLAYLAILLLVLALLTDYLPALRETAQTLWFLPAALGAVALVVQVIYSFTTWLITGYSTGSSVLLSLLTGAGLLFAGLWIVYPKGLPDRQTAPAAQDPAAGEGTLPFQAHCGILKHTLLLVFTFGIWHLIWIYRTTGTLNCAPEQPYRNPTTKLLLCLFIPFYHVYWSYHSAQRVDLLARKAGIPSDLTLPCLLLSLTVPILSAVLLQDKINTLVTTPAGGPQAPQAVQDLSEALRTLKNLLDDGLITQDDYDAKKKQLLAL